MRGLRWEGWVVLDGRPINGLHALVVWMKVKAGGRAPFPLLVYHLLHSS
jgi:hypothetical protein